MKQKIMTNEVGRSGSALWGCRYSIPTPDDVGEVLRCQDSDEKVRNILVLCTRNGTHPVLDFDVSQNKHAPVSTLSCNQWPMLLL